MVVAIPFFQQFTRMNAIMFYAPMLFKTIGFGDNASLMSTVITGPVNVLSTFVSILTVSINLLFTFVIAQAFLAMLCHFKVGIFLFFAGWGGRHDSLRLFLSP